MIIIAGWVSVSGEITVCVNDSWLLRRVVYHNVTAFKKKTKLKKSVIIYDLKLYLILGTTVHCTPDASG